MQGIDVERVLRARHLHGRLFAVGRQVRGCGDFARISQFRRHVAYWHVQCDSGYRYMHLHVSSPEHCDGIVRGTCYWNCLIFGTQAVYCLAERFAGCDGWQICACPNNFVVSHSGFPSGNIVFMESLKVVECGPGGTDPNAANLRRLRGGCPVS